MPQIKLTNDVLAAALAGFEIERDRIAGRIAEIKSLLGSGSSDGATQPTTGRPRKKRSAAVRRRMKLAQQLRWEKIRKAAGSAQAPAGKPKRTMSATARKRIAEAQRKRWAATRKSSAAQSGKRGKKTAAGSAPEAEVHAV